MTARPAEDTPPEVVQALVDRLRSMSPAERVGLADQLSVDIATFAVAGIRARNPEITEADLLHELARRRYGAELADAAYGGSGRR